MAEQLLKLTWFRIVFGIGCIIGGIAFVVYSLNTSSQDLGTKTGIILGGGFVVLIGILLLIATAIRQKQGRLPQQLGERVDGQKIAADLRDSVKENLIGAIPGSDAVQFAQQVRTSRRTQIIFGLALVGVGIYATVTSLQNKLSDGVVGGAVVFGAGVLLLVISFVLARRQKAKVPPSSS